jgi:hypothetical protein
MRKNRGVQIWTPHNTGVTANDNTPTKKRNIRPFRKTHLLSEQIASVAMTHKTSFYGTLRWLGGTPKTPWHLGGGTKNFLRPLATAPNKAERKKSFGTARTASGHSGNCTTFARADACTGSGSVAGSWVTLCRADAFSCTRASMSLKGFSSSIFHLVTL